MKTGVDYDAIGMPMYATIGMPKDPTEMAMQVSSLLIDNIRAYNDKAGLEFRRMQCAFSKKLVNMCADLKEAEADSKRSMDLHVQRILESKRTVLFKQTPEEISYPDAKVAIEMDHGFPLCGWLPASDVISVRVRASEFDQSFLRSMARSFTARSMAATMSLIRRQFFFRPTPSWLSPGRSTSLYLPENEFVIRMHVRQRRRASKEGDSEPVQSPMSIPRPHKQKHETKSKTKTKQKAKPKQNKTKQNKTKTKNKNPQAQNQAMKE